MSFILVETADTIFGVNIAFFAGFWGTKLINLVSNGHSSVGGNEAENCEKERIAIV